MIEKRKAPPLIPLGEINTNLVDDALRSKKENGGVVPPSPAALEFVRYLRTTGVFDKKEPRNLVNRNYFPGDV